MTTIRTLSRVYIALMGLVVVVAALLGALFIALSISKQETNCINRILGERNPIAAADAKAHSTFAAQVAAGAEDGRLTAAEVTRAATAYERALRANQVSRDLHPLGQC